MQYIKDTGYIIKRRNTKEADKYLTILTQDNGKIDVLAKGVRKLSSKRSGSIELMSKVSFQAVSVKNGGSYVLTEVQLLESHTQFKSTLEHLKVLFIICELLSVLCPHGQKHQDIFMLVNKTLSDLHTSPHAFVLQSFQVKLLSSLGYWDPARVFIDRDDINHFTEQVMQKKLRSTTFF